MAEESIHPLKSCSMRGEITALTAAIREGETRRSADVDRLTTALAGVPKAAEIRRDNRVAVAWAVGSVLALLALLWTVFGVGASITGGVADRVIQTREEQRAAKLRENRLLETQQQILLEIKKDDRFEDRNAVQPTPQINVVGNRS